MLKGSGWNWRSMVSFSLSFSTIVLLGSGVALLIAPIGRIAHATGWQVLGFDKEGWESIHDLFGFAFILLAGIHLYLNRKAIMCYLRDRAHKLRLRPEPIVALLLTGVIWLIAALHLLPL